MVTATNSPDADQSATSADLLTLDEAAIELRVGRTTIYNLMNSGELKSITIGRRRFILREDLDRFCATRRRVSPRPGGRR